MCNSAYLWSWESARRESWWLVWWRRCCCCYVWKMDDCIMLKRFFFWISVRATAHCSVTKSGIAHWSIINHSSMFEFPFQWIRQKQLHWGFPSNGNIRIVCITLKRYVGIDIYYSTVHLKNFHVDISHPAKKTCAYIRYKLDRTNLFFPEKLE